MIRTRLLAPALASALLLTAAPAAAAPAASEPAATPRTVSTSALPAGAIGPWKAAKRVGRYKTVCGKVKSTKYARSSSGQPTFLNLGRAYPRNPFTIVIWREDRWRYPRAPQRMFRYKTVCVRGRISKYNGTAQIIARSNKVWRP